MGLISRVSSRTYRSKMTNVSILIIFGLFKCSLSQLSEKGVVYASKCEACKYMAIELEGRLKETGKIKDKIEVGRFTTNNYKKAKIVDYSRSELRLIESLHGDEESDTKGVCERMLEY